MISSGHSNYNGRKGGSQVKWHKQRQVSMEANITWCNLSYLHNVGTFPTETTAAKVILSQTTIFPQPNQTASVQPTRGMSVTGTLSGLYCLVTVMYVVINLFSHFVKRTCCRAVPFSENQVAVARSWNKINSDKPNKPPKTLQPV